MRQELLGISDHSLDINLLALQVQIDCNDTSIEISHSQIQPLVDQGPQVQIILAVQLVVSRSPQVPDDGVRGGEVALGGLQQG